ncbi:MAG: RDD family protein [Bacteroidales bacterium]|nr:RDD family protein [Bacteroidales bacterium]
MAAVFRTIAKNVLTLRWLEREIAFCVDLFVCAAIAICPNIGYAAAVLYFIIRDACPFGMQTNLGKSVYGLRVVNENGENPSWRSAILRNIVVFIPFANIYDFYLFISTGDRLADRWSQTHVAKVGVVSE